MLRLELTAASQREWLAMIERAEALGRPGEDEMRPLQEVIRAGFAINFMREAGNDAPWAPLSLWTIRERLRLGYAGAHPILYRSGSYHDSFVEDDHPLHVSETGESGGLWWVEEGSRDPRAEELEFGRWNMPGRPVTLLGESGDVRIEMVLEELFGHWFDEV